MKNVKSYGVFEGREGGRTVASFRDYLRDEEEGPEVRSGWLSALAQSEMDPQREGSPLDPQYRVKESALLFLKQTREALETFIHRLNAYSEKGARFTEVRLYALAQTEADFMLFRNQVKLVFSHAASGVLRIEWIQHVQPFWNRLESSGDPKSPAFSSASPSPTSQELLIQMDVFRELHWTFQGERISPQQVARHYLIEFCQATRAQGKKSGSRQLLLEEIQSLLDQKRLGLKELESLRAIQRKI